MSTETQPCQDRHISVYADPYPRSLNGSAGRSIVYGLVTLGALVGAVIGYGDGQVIASTFAGIGIGFAIGIGSVVLLKLLVQLRDRN